MLWGTLDELRKTIVETRTRTLAGRYRGATYITITVSKRIQAAMTNVASKYICQTPNMGGSVLKGHAIMTSPLTSSMTKCLQKEY